MMCDQHVNPDPSWATIASVMTERPAVSAGQPILRRREIRGAHEQRYNHPVDPCLTSATETEDDAGEFQYQRHQRRSKRLRNSSSPSTAQLPPTVRFMPTRNARPRIVGRNATGSAIISSGKVVNKRIFCVNNVDSKFTEEDIKTFLESNNIRVISCFLAKSKYIGSKAFRVCITADSLDLFFNADFWPQDVVISEWFFKPKLVENSTMNNDGVIY